MPRDRRPMFEYPPEFMAWLRALPPRDELCVRRSMIPHFANIGGDRVWTARIDELMAQLKIDSTAKLATLMRDEQRFDRIIKEWFEQEGGR